MQNTGYRSSRNRFSRNRGNSRSFGRGNSFQPRKSTTKRKFMWSEYDLIQTVIYSKQAEKHSQTEKAEISNTEFSTLNVSKIILENISRKKYLTMSPVQELAIPAVLNGKDIIGIANTGTGKTAAFLIPLIDKVIKNRSNKVLILAPTRELAEQINSEFISLALRTQIYSALIIGGSSFGKQIAEIRRNPNFLIATPGRLKDLVNRKIINLSDFNNVVLDETDRMVDIGFVNEIKMFIEMLPKQRQSLFFSATITPKVEEILNSFVQNPVSINVKKADSTKNIKQELIRVGTGQRKIETLIELLEQDHFKKVIVFSNTKWNVEKLMEETVQRGIKADSIHGNKTQYQRRQTLEKFKRDEINILFATDVAARGLDISNVTHVINYDIPSCYEDYIHRIGRTGRADKTGIALSFVNARS